MFKHFSRRYAARPVLGLAPSPSWNWETGTLNPLRLLCLATAAACDVHTNFEVCFLLLDILPPLTLDWRCDVWSKITTTMDTLKYIISTALLFGRDFHLRILANGPQQQFSLAVSLVLSLLSALALMPL